MTGVTNLIEMKDDSQLGMGRDENSCFEFKLLDKGLNGDGILLKKGRDLG